MEEIDDKILQLINYNGQTRLVSILRKCLFDIEQTNSFGNNGSYQCGLYLYTDIKTLEITKKLLPEENKSIINAWNTIFIPRLSGLEITWLEYELDINQKIPTNNIPIEEQFNNLDIEIINIQIEKINKKMQNKDYDGAITNSRSLLESLLKFILIENNIEIIKNEDLISLYKKVTQILHMNPSDYEEKYFKKILSGFFTIIQGVGEIRNQFSDAHGVESGKFYKLEERHVRLTIDGTKSICNYLYASNLWNKNHKKLNETPGV